MASLQKLKSYRNHVFDDYGGVTSPDYKKFERAYLNYIKSFCKDNAWTFIRGTNRHYDFSAVIQREDGVYVYISVDDVRYNRNGWYNTILIRTMKDAQDWRGGQNHFTNLDNLILSIKNLH